MVATDAAWVASDIPGVADYLLKYLNMLDFKAAMGFFGAPKALMSRGTGIQFVQAALCLGFCRQVRTSDLAIGRAKFIAYMLLTNPV